MKNFVQSSFFKHINTSKPMALGYCAATMLAISCSGPKFMEESTGDFSLVKNEGGETLGYSTNSGVKLMTVDGFAFKDLNKDGKLDVYEDWRLPADERAKDLASKLSV